LEDLNEGSHTEDLVLKELGWEGVIRSWLRRGMSVKMVIILLLSSHLCLGLASGACPSGLLTKTLYAPPLPPVCASVLTYHDYFIMTFCT
jgi:hypothetical protein